MLKLSNIFGSSSGVTGAAPPSDTKMYVWGDNTQGQAGGGSGTADPVLIPTETDDTAGITLSNKSFSRAKHAAFIIGNKLYTTGANTAGQLAQGNQAGLDEFTIVSTNGSATDFALGEKHTLTVRDGKVNGCGNNSEDQLVEGTSSSSTLSIIVPPSEIGDADASKVYASRYSSGVLTTINDFYVWGQSVVNTQGSTTGDPYSLRNIFPTEFAGGGDKPVTTEFTDAGLGDTHIILLSAERRVYTQSKSNAYGQQGNGGTGTSSEEVDLFDRIATKVAAGRYTSYVIADGILYAAGRGDNGEMGGATTAQINRSFIDIGGGITDWIDVQAGEDFVIAQRQDGTLYHSGKNTSAQQGNGATGSAEFGFVQIVGDTTAKVYTAFTVARRTVYGIST